MVSSLSKSVNNRSIGFSVFDQLSYSDNSLPLVCGTFPESFVIIFVVEKVEARTVNKVRW
jgi:hypothetical protein